MRRTPKGAQMEHQRTQMSWNLNKTLLYQLSKALWGRLAAAESTKASAGMCRRHCLKIVSCDVDIHRPIQAWAILRLREMWVRTYPSMGPSHQKLSKADLPINQRLGPRARAGQPSQSSKTKIGPATATATTTTTTNSHAWGPRRCFSFLKI